MNNCEIMSDSSANHSHTIQSIADYLAQLLKDRTKVNVFPNVFIHVERLIDEEITRVRSNLFQVNGVKKEPLILPEPAGESVTLTEKVFVPVEDHPDLMCKCVAVQKRNMTVRSHREGAVSALAFPLLISQSLTAFNFVGRILGPRGMTAKQLEIETGCKIMVRGKGSMRDKKKEEQNRGKPNWEHLNEELHVLISVEDTENRAKVKMQRAIEEVNKFIVPADGEDELKKRQLMELAIINGTYRDSESMRALAAAAACDEEWHRIAVAAAADTQRLLSPGMPTIATSLRTPTATPLATPLILSSRIPTAIPTTAASLLNGSTAPQVLTAPEPHGFIYTPYTTDYANFAALPGSPLLTTAEYPALDHSVLMNGPQLEYKILSGPTAGRSWTTLLYV